MPWSMRLTTSGCVAVVLHSGQKYLTHEGREQLFDLAGDPDETVDLLRGR